MRLLNAKRLTIAEESAEIMMVLGNVVLGNSSTKLVQFPMPNQNKCLLISIMINNVLLIKFENRKTP